MDRRVQVTIELMKADLRRELSPDDLARATNLSRSRFQHLFKAETGVSPASYLRLLRLERARFLLETSFLSIKQIMLRVGVADKSHFERRFKKAYGATPTGYRAARPPLAPHAAQAGRADLNPGAQTATE